MKRLVVLLASLSLLVGAFAPPALAGPPAHASRLRQRSESLDDPAKQKLDAKLRNALDRGSNATVAVFATVVGNPSRAHGDAQTARMPPGPRTARPRSSSAGSRSSSCPSWPARRTSSRSTSSSSSRPASRSATPTRTSVAPPRAQKALQAALAELEATDVPYADAPPLKGSNFEALKKLALLDAKTHDFAEAWKMGYDGTGRHACRSSTAAPTGAIPT